MHASMKFKMKRRKDKMEEKVKKGKMKKEKMITFSDTKCEHYLESSVRKQDAENMLRDH